MSTLYHIDPAIEHIFGFLTKSCSLQASVSFIGLMMIG